MERQANYALVGALSLALLIGALVFVVWLAQFQFNQKYDAYRIIFRGPVSGLSRGGEVQFNGIKVGEITRIALDQRDPNRVITDIDVERGTPVRADSMAQTVAQGITGVKYVQITPGSPDRPLLRKVSRERPPVIQASRSRLDSLVNDITELSRGGAEALGRVNRLLSDQNIATLSRSLDDVGAITGEFRARKAMFANIDSTFAKLDRAATELQLTAASVRGTLGGKGRGTLGDVAGAAAELRAAAADTRKLIARIDGPVTEFSTTTVPSINAAMNSIQEAADAMDRLASDIQQDPQGLLTRPEGKEVEIPQ